MSDKKKSIQFPIPEITYQKILVLAKEIDAVSETDRPMAGTAVKKITKAIIAMFEDERFVNRCEHLGVDPLSFIRMCVRKELR